MNDRLRGDTGSDTLVGGVDGDRMVGGSGDDLFYVDTSTDIVFELSGGGNDRVIVTAETYTLARHVEILRNERDDTARALTSNSAGATLVGSSAGHRLYGQGGTDFRFGGLGDDTLNGQSGDDLLQGRSGVDRLSGGLGDDVLNGEGDADLRDLLQGGSGLDRLQTNNNGAAFGGSGGDQFILNGDETGSLGGGGTLEALAVIADFEGALISPDSNQDTLVFATGQENGAFAYVEAAAFSGSGTLRRRPAAAGSGSGRRWRRRHGRRHEQHDQRQPADLERLSVLGLENRLASGWVRVSKEAGLVDLDDVGDHRPKTSKRLRDLVTVL